MIALDLLVMPRVDRINGKRVVDGPRGVIVESKDWDGKPIDVVFVEWYTGSDDPERLDYCRQLVRGDIEITMSA